MIRASFASSALFSHHTLLYNGSNSNNHRCLSICLQLWIYYSSLILYFGAEFTKAYATTYGGLIQPNQYAVWVKQVEIETGTGSLKQNEQKKREKNEATGDEVKVK